MTAGKSINIRQLAEMMTKYDVFPLEVDGGTLDLVIASDMRRPGQSCIAPATMKDMGK